MCAFGHSFVRGHRQISYARRGKFTRGVGLQGGTQFIRAQAADVLVKLQGAGVPSTEACIVISKLRVDRIQAYVGVCGVANQNTESVLWNFGFKIAFWQSA